MKDITTIRITKDTHKEILKIMGQIQARTGEIPTLDDALQEMLSNYKKKSKKIKSKMSIFNEIVDKK